MPILNNRSLPCRTCGKPVQLPDSLFYLDNNNREVICLNCWEVETRIDEYAKSDKGRKILTQILDQYKE